MRTMPFITIPRSITGNEELVVLPKRQFEEILKEKQVDENEPRKHRTKTGKSEFLNKEISSNEILRWSREAKKMHKLGKLEVLSSLKDLR